MVRQAAFNGNGTLLKGALHCHTTRSDGRGTPEEVIRLHKQEGYDFMALTDHRIYNYKNYAPDTDMIILPGMEIDSSFKGEPRAHACYHTVVLGPAEGNPYSQDQRFSFDRVDNQEQFQKNLDIFHQSGHLTMLCHPEWSLTPVCEFDRLKGNFAMEIWNTGCVLDNGLDANAAYWDDLLMQGQRIYGCAVDDGHPMDQHCKGWVYVKAERNIVSILDALRDGAFYSSCGPQIKDFYVENGKAVVECSPCTEIVFRAGRIQCPRLYSEKGDLCRHECHVPDFLKYIRVTVTDKEGRRAWSNPIFFD